MFFPDDVFRTMEKKDVHLTYMEGSRQEDVTIHYWIEWVEFFDQLTNLDYTFRFDIYFNEGIYIRSVSFHTMNAGEKLRAKQIAALLETEVKNHLLTIPNYRLRVLMNQFPVSMDERISAYPTNPDIKMKNRFFDIWIDGDETGIFAPLPSLLFSFFFSIIGIVLIASYFLHQDRSVGTTIIVLFGFLFAQFPVVLTTLYGIRCWRDTKQEHTLLKRVKGGNENRFS